MARTTQKTHFPCVTSAGGLLPADFLLALKSGLAREGDEKIPGLTPKDYHLGGESFGEATNRAWNALQGRWEHFKSYLDEGDPNPTQQRQTWDRFLRPLFRELGYGQLERDLTVAIDTDSYTITHHWRDIAIHLLGAGVSIDKRTPEVVGAARKSPHAMVQEFLNRSEDHLWAFVSNGLSLRILRDNVSLTRQAYVEFDLYAIFEGGEYADFQLLWLLCHQSRVEGTPPTTCWLERWATEAKKRGVRMLDGLRNGVETAINALGEGFLKNSANTELRQRLESGELSTQDYYRQVLRIVYRLIFLFVAEDRNLLLLPEASTDAKKRYREHYATSRLRELSQSLRGSIHPDLWEQLKLVFRALGSDTGEPALALPPLGSFLWKANQSTPDLAEVTLSNSYLLDAFRALATIRSEKLRRVVDYRNMGAEELGSVYESLLELHPEINLDARSFLLGTSAGNDRKTSGSYYTPDSLVQSLLDTALEPVIAQKLKDAGREAADREQALLSLKVCDPAVGSGHFLIAAAHRIARHLAAVRSGEDEPSPTDYQDALRDVVGRCLYGVDINPMAVELCKVSLWIEAMEPGKPLSFLDHHIRCGNALLGTTPELLGNGIPNEAFKPITGDNKDYCSQWRRVNTKELRERNEDLLINRDNSPWQRLGNAPAAIAALDSLPDETVADISAKANRFAQAVRNSDYLNATFLHDAWCAAFVWKKTNPDEGGFDYPLTNGELFKIERNPHSCPIWMREEIQRLASSYQFFHWHLAFPEVFSSGGFDTLLGNPPWEHVELKEKEFFANRDTDIAKAPNGAARKRHIEALQTENPFLYNSFKDTKRFHEGLSSLMGNSGRYPLCGRGRINYYAIFAELFRYSLNPTGRFGAVLPSGIASDDTTKFYFQDLVTNYSLASLYDFENRNIFPNVHSSYKFCLLTAGRGLRKTADQADLAFFCHAVEDLRLPGRRFTLSPEDFELLNPNTRTCPIFRSTCDAELTKAIYRRVPVLIQEARDTEPENNPWNISFRQGLFNMTSDSGHFRTREQLSEEGYHLEGNLFRGENSEDYLPLYEAKMVHHYDHRWATYQSSTDSRDVTLTEKQDPTFSPLPRYWVSRSEVNKRLPRHPEILHQAIELEDDDQRQQALFKILTLWLAGRSWNLDQEAAAEGFYQRSRAIHLPASPLEVLSEETFRAEAQDLARDYPLSAEDLQRFEREADNLTPLATDLAARFRPKWLTGFRDICRSTDERTAIFSIFPATAVGNNCPLALSSDEAGFCLSWIFSSFGTDYASRLSVGGTHMNFYILKQVPTLPPAKIRSSLGQISGKILETVFTSHSLRELAKDLNYDGPPFRWDEERRFQLRCELDALFFHLYLPCDDSGDWKPARMAEGAVRDESEEELATLKSHFPTPREAVAYIMDTFPIVRRKDLARTEQKDAVGNLIQEGSYRTKNRILEIYDAMLRARRENREWQSPLNPPPGPPCDEEGNFLPFESWRNNIPSHIHPPQD